MTAAVFWSRIISIRGDVAKSWLCVVGNEANVITLTGLNECSHDRLRISMTEGGVDALSVSVAARILLHGLVLRAQQLLWT